MALQTLIKCFDFGAVNIRSKLTFSDPTKIRLNPDTNNLELSPQSIHRATGKTVYPLDTELFVTVAETNPQALLQWTGFASKPRPEKQPTNTSVSFRLNDGTDTLYWDGASWDIAGVGDWNSVQEITANISTFPTTDQKLSLQIKLQTTDKFETPSVASVDLLMSCRINYLESLIARSLIPSLKSKLQPLIEVALHARGNDKIVLNLEENPNIVSVEAVYDKTSDPHKRTNLYSSFDPTTKIVTLTSVVERGNELRVEFVAEPEVYLNFSSQDYTEVEKIPAVVLDSFSISGNEVKALFEVEDINTEKAVLRQIPFRLALQFEVLLLAKGNRVLLRMMDEALNHATNTPTLCWKDLDEQITLKIIDEGNFNPRPNLSDIHQTQYTLRLEDVFLWLRPEETFNLVQNLNFVLTSPDLEGGATWTGVK